MPHDGLLKYKTRCLNPALENPYFFGVQGGLKKMRHDNFRRDLQVVLRKAKIVDGTEKIRIPQLFPAHRSNRHAHHTNDIYRVKQTLGHRQIQTTNKYRHVVNELTAKKETGASALSMASKYRQLANQ
jgi:site-specific recombinase XerD